MALQGACQRRRSVARDGNEGEEMLEGINFIILSGDEVNNLLKAFPWFNKTKYKEWQELGILNLIIEMRKWNLHGAVVMQDIYGNDD